jgi:hypothetical protein
MLLLTIGSQAAGVKQICQNVDGRVARLADRAAQTRLEVTLVPSLREISIRRRSCIGVLSGSRHKKQFDEIIELLSSNLVIRAP